MDDAAQKAYERGEKAATDRIRKVIEGMKKHQFSPNDGNGFQDHILDEEYNTALTDVLGVLDKDTK